MKSYHKHIVNLVPEHSQILDLGCGDGDLLKLLETEKAVTAYGIDHDFRHILNCTQNGISAIQGDLNQGLDAFSDKSYDTVILSQTLQQVRDPKTLLKEMLRIGKTGIVSFPNFAHYKVRFNLLFNGQAPMTKELPHHWYDTPNIRVLSINDFKSLCKDAGISIIEEIPLYKSTLLKTLIPKCCSNFFAEKVIFVVKDNPK